MGLGMDEKPPAFTKAEIRAYFHGFREHYTA